MSASSSATALIAHHFFHRRKTYSQAAIVQKDMAVRLAKDVEKLLHIPTARIFEIGCGTGNLSRELFKRVRPSHYIANDLFPCIEIEEISRQHNVSFEFLMGDICRLPWPTQMDIICSNAVFQWINDPASLIEISHRSLNPGGLFAFSTFLPGNFQEFRQTTGVGLEYVPLEHWHNLFQEKWQLLKSTGDTSTLFFKSPQEVLEHIRATGVGGVTNRNWTRETYHAFINNYPRTSDNLCPLSYHFHHFIVQKKIRTP